MTSPQLNRVTNVYGFISAPVSPMKTKLGKKVDQYALILLYSYDDVKTTRSRDWCLLFCLHFYKPYNN